MLDTYFAPAERTERRKFEQQLDVVGRDPLMSALLRAVGGLLVVLNEDRQIVALNHAFLETLGIDDPGAVLGLRLGESLHCIHAAGAPNGCGTTAHCMSCGAAIAMMAAIDDDRTDERVCALTSEIDGVRQDASLLIRAQPLAVGSGRWILVFAQDITQQQFWAALERVFFHDINNVLTAVQGYSEVLAMRLPEDPAARQLLLAVERLANEISVQRTLSHGKDAHYPVSARPVPLSEIRREVDLVLAAHPAARNRTIQTIGPAEDLSLVTDALLASRVLVNMLVNALEATPEGGTVTLTTGTDPGHVVWQVWNRAPIGLTVQKRIFQRHFSTKAQVGRGLGTYSMKLFGERYLSGEVGFESDPDRGTIFTFRIPRLSWASPEHPTTH
jgi:signal transduction histidine kinase